MPQFLEWSIWSNDVLRITAGLRQRRLLRGADGSYAAIVEHDGSETFAQMHRTGEAARIQAGLATILDERPHATSFEVAAELVPDSPHCCEGGGEARVATLDPNSADTTTARTGCCD